MSPSFLKCWGSNSQVFGDILQHLLASYVAIQKFAGNLISSFGNKLSFFFFLISIAFKIFFFVFSILQFHYNISWCGFLIIFPA